MKKEYKVGQHVYRLPPCPSFDVEGMECWLSDMAQEGLFLVKDGFFVGVATFEYAEPHPTKYRLEAAQKNTSMWSEDGGEPDPELIELSEKYTWNYIAKRGEFYIYRSFEPGARELNTDPEVQALAMNAVKKKQGRTVFYLMFWLIVYPVILTHGGLILSIFSMKTWLFLLTALFVIWKIADELIAFISLGKLQKKLRSHGALASDRDWRKGSLRHYAKRAIQLVLVITLVCLFLHNWSVSIMDEDVISLESYTGDIPFATISDFAGEGSSDYKMTMMGMSMGFNTIRERLDWLAPRYIEYNEHAQIILADGHILEGGLYVDYFEASSSYIAGRLAKEYKRIDKWKKGFKPLEEPDLKADFVTAYSNELHFPTVIIQKDRIVIRAYFYQTSSDYSMELEEWAKILADSLPDN